MRVTHPRCTRRSQWLPLRRFSCSLEPFPRRDSARPPSESRPAIHSAAGAEEKISTIRWLICVFSFRLFRSSDGVTTRANSLRSPLAALPTLRSLDAWRNRCASGLSVNEISFNFAIIWIPLSPSVRQSHCEHDQNNCSAVRRPRRICYQEWLNGKAWLAANWSERLDNTFCALPNIQPFWAINSHTSAREFEKQTKCIFSLVPLADVCDSVEYFVWFMSEVRVSDVSSVFLALFRLNMWSNRRSSLSVAPRALFSFSAWPGSHTERESTVHYVRMQRSINFESPKRAYTYF